MPGIEIKGRSKIANYRHGGRTGKFGGGRTNLLEELGRVEAEPSNRNRRAEISRVHGELNRGYKTGGRVGKAIGGWMLKKPVQKLLEGIGGGSEKKPHSTRAGRISAGVRKIKRGVKEAKKFGSEKGSDWKKGKFGKKTVAAMKKHDFPAGGPHQSLEGKKAALQHATIRAGEPKKKKVDWEKGKFSKATLAAMKKHDFPGGGPHQTVAGKKAGLRHASIRAKEAEGGRIGLKQGGGSAVWLRGRSGQTIKAPRGKEGWKQMKDYEAKIPKGKKAGMKALETRIEKAGPSEQKAILTNIMGGGRGRPKGGSVKERTRVAKVEDAMQQKQSPWSNVPGSKKPYKKGGKVDKKWIQKAVDPKHKGYCTPMTKKTCTPARKALARTFKKKAKTGWS